MPKPSLNVAWLCTVIQVVCHNRQDVSLIAHNIFCSGLLSLCESLLNTAWEALVQCLLPGEGRYFCPHEHAVALKDSSFSWQQALH